MAEYVKKVDMPQVDAIQVVWGYPDSKEIIPDGAWIIKHPDGKTTYCDDNWFQSHYVKK